MSSWPSICVSECCAAVCHNIAKFHRCKMDVTLVKSVAPLSTHSSFCFFFFFACQIFALGIILQENQNYQKMQAIYNAKNDRKFDNKCYMVSVIMQ